MLFFIYVGLEFTVGQWAFTVFTEWRAFPENVAGVLVGCYYGSIGIGRILSGLIVARLGLSQMVTCSLSLAIAGAVLYEFSDSIPLASIAVVLLGLGLAPVFPCVMAATPQRMSSGYAAHAIGFQVSAAMIGGAIIPALAGMLSTAFGLPSLVHFSLFLAVLLFLLHLSSLPLTKRWQERTSPLN